VASVRSKIPAILPILAALVLAATNRALAAPAVDCNPTPRNPAITWVTGDDHGRTVEFPPRINFPAQQRPLVVMTYNIAGHDERFRSTHIAQIVAAINEVKPDIVGLEEVHRHTWQSRYRDQLEELEVGTGMHGFFGASFQHGNGQFGNAILTRGDIISAVVHPLPGRGEPRTLIESVLRIDGAIINFYVTHLTAWDRMNASVRGRQLDCVAKYIRTSTYPFLLAGDFNAAPGAPEVIAFDRENLAQLCGRTLPVTNPLLHKRIDYIWADYGWEVNRTWIPYIGPSDHWPVVAELKWIRR
jgi:endonuclease/exonuclease/phosphatase family metal-dependent hydrolase